MKHNLFHKVRQGPGISGQITGNVDAGAIENPSLVAEQMAIFVNYGAAAPAGCRVLVQWRDRAGTWANLREDSSRGTADLVMTSTGPNTQQIGTIELQRVPADTQALRVRVEAAAATDIGVSVALYMLEERPGGVTDQLWDAQRSA